MQRRHALALAAAALLAAGAALRTESPASRALRAPHTVAQRGPEEGVQVEEGAASPRPAQPAAQPAPPTAAGLLAALSEKPGDLVLRGRTVAHLRRWMRSAADHRTRARAAFLLVARTASPPTRIEPWLCEMLDGDPHAGNRRLAIELLGLLGRRRALSPATRSRLLRVARSAVREPRLRRAARGALAEAAGGTERTERTLALLERGALSERRQTARAWRRRPLADPDDATCQRIANLLLHEQDQEVRRTLVYAIEHQAFSSAGVVRRRLLWMLEEAAARTSDEALAQELGRRLAKLGDG